MRVLVNAVSLKEGGGRAVLANLLPAMSRARPEIDWLVAAPPATCGDLHAGHVEPLAVDVGRTPLHLLKWYEHETFVTARRWRADVLFSLTNYLPHRRLGIPTLLLEQHAGHFSSLFERLTQDAAGSALARIAWRRKRHWVHRSVEAATVLTVQTAALADAVAASTRVARPAIRVVPHGPGWVEHAVAAETRGGGDPFRIGYVSKWGVQKDFVTLFRAVDVLAREGRAVRLVLTLDPGHAPAARLLADAEAMGVADLIENQGEVFGSRITQTYDSLDVFAFPSLCESFGMPMVEAMARGLPMVVADTPENREITGTAGHTFPPRDAGALAVLLRTLMDDAEARRAAAERSLARAQDFSWAKAAEGTLAALDAAVAEHQRPGVMSQSSRAAG